MPSSWGALHSRCGGGREVVLGWCRPSKWSLVGAIWGGGPCHPPISTPSNALVIIYVLSPWGPPMRQSDAATKLIHTGANVAARDVDWFSPLSFAQAAMNSEPSGLASGGGGGGGR